VDPRAQILEKVINSLACFCAGFKKYIRVIFCKKLSRFKSNHFLCFSDITFISCNSYHHFLVFYKISKFLYPIFQTLKAEFIRDIIHQQSPYSSPVIQGSHSSKPFCSTCIPKMNFQLFPIDQGKTFLKVCTTDCYFIDFFKNVFTKSLCY